MRSTTAAYDWRDLAEIATEHDHSSAERPLVLANSTKRPAQAFRKVTMRHWRFAQIINEIPARYIAASDPFWTAHIDSLGTLTGSFNFERAVLPPRRSNASIPDDATADAPTPFIVHLLVAHCT